LAGRIVLAAGGAGAVGHAAIQLALWAGARVVATVSNEAKGALARAAGADLVVDYTSDDASKEIRDWAPEGVDIVVEVAPAANARLDADVLAPNGTVAAYAAERGLEVGLDVRALFARNIRYEFVLVYTVTAEAKSNAVLDVSAAVSDGALPVGEEAGLPLHRFSLADTAAAHAAVEGGAVGKVLIDVA
jgi:NADPH2:quinone reductase